MPLEEEEAKGSDVLIVQIVMFPCAMAVLWSITAQEGVFGTDITKVRRYQ
jgi:hypothetical protein